MCGDLHVDHERDVQALRRPLLGVLSPAVITNSGGYVGVTDELLHHGDVDTGIEAAMLNNLSNALIESTNTKIRVLHRMAFGFATPEHLIALALLDRGGYCPPLPGRHAA